MAIWLFVIAAAVSAGLTWWLARFGRRTGLGVLWPRPRDTHTRAVPRLGGVAVSASFLIIALGLAILMPDRLNFIAERVWGLDRNVAGIVAGVVILLGFGLADDIRALSPGVKLASHFLAGGVLAWSAVLVPHITNPLGGQIVLGSWAYPFVIVWVVLMINVINWLDGLDGLASGVSLIATVVLWLLAIKPEVNQISMSLLAIILAGSLAGFLPFNFYPAKIFLGDSGSQVIGFLLAAFSIISGGKLATAFLVLGVPILDVIWVIIRRLMTRKPVYRADRFHLHHRLLRAGLSQKQAVLLLYAVSAIFGVAALETQSYGKLIAVACLASIMVFGGAVLASRELARRRQVGN